MDDETRYSNGIKVRREVLGDEHVDRVTKAATDIDREFQDFITRYAWGEIWSREGLPRSTRSLITIATLVALNRPGELRMHLRAAVRNGVTAMEIRELLLHTAIYCGLPAANEAFKIASEVFTESSLKQP
jgi:4-carboxymuconolactone decarboxylase